MFILINTKIDTINKLLQNTMNEKTHTVLVPAAGGPAGVNVIKSLKLGGFNGRIIATDAEPLSAGFFLASSYAVLPRSSNEDHFLHELFNVIRKNNVQVLMPSSQTDGFVYSKHRKGLEGLHAIPIISDVKSLQTCIDKAMTFQELSGMSDIIPFTTTDPEKVREFPIIAKPRFGRGSRNVFKIDDEADLGHVVSKFDDMIFQEFLPGTEYTVDVLSDLHKNPLIAVVRVRLETKAGISSKGMVVRRPDIEEICMKVAAQIGIRGPCCIQVKESKDGQIKLVEVNPRIGGGTIITTLAGANFPTMILDMVEGRRVQIPKISEITVVRYFDEVVVNQSKGVITALPTSERSSAIA
jgi:carbamoyl-phosphate synthase large subunit